MNRIVGRSLPPRRTLLPALALLLIPSLSGAFDPVKYARPGGAAVDGPGPYAPVSMFGSISHIAIAGDGSVYAADAQLRQIRHYGNDGVFIADVGRFGDGPGEYREIMGMTVLRSGTLVVLSNPGRLTYYVRDIYDIDRTIRSTLAGSDLLTHDDDGFLYVKEVDDRSIPGQRPSFCWLKIDSQGNEFSRVEIPDEAPDHAPFVLMFPEGARENFPVKTLSAMTPGGYLVTGRNDEYAFDIHRPDGVVHVTRGEDVVKLQREERAEWRSWAAFFERNGTTTYDVPGEKPFYRGLYVDATGSIWVHRYVDAKRVAQSARAPGDPRPLSRWREPNVFDVFTAEGKYQQTIHLPMFARTAFRNPVLWGVDTTDDGEILVPWLTEQTSIRLYDTKADGADVTDQR